MDQAFKDYYLILRLPREASPNEVRRAYRERMKLFHPDRLMSDPRLQTIGEAEAKEINEAYETLSDPQQRMHYDKIWQLYQAGPSAFQVAADFEKELDRAREQLDNAGYRLRQSQVANDRLQRELIAARAQLEEMRTKQQLAAQRSNTDEITRLKAMTERYEAQIQTMLKELDRRSAESHPSQKDLSPRLTPATRGAAGVEWRSFRPGSIIALLSIVLLVALLGAYLGVLSSLAKSPIPTPTLTDNASTSTQNTNSRTIKIEESEDAQTASLANSRSAIASATEAPTSKSTMPTLTGTAASLVKTGPTSRANAVVPATVSAAMGLVLADHLNVHSGPGTSYPIVAVVKQGASFPILGKDREAPLWWYVEPNSASGSGWISADPELVFGVNALMVPVVAAPLVTQPTLAPTITKTLRPTPTLSQPRSTPTPVDKPKPTVAPSQPVAPAQPTATVASPNQWVLTADSVSDFPDSRPERQWWYLFSDGRNNFEWREMDRQDQGCHKAPGEHGGRICADRASTDAHGDIALQWKARRGGRYLLEWEARVTDGTGEVLVYKHASQIASQGAGPTLPSSYVDDNIIDWEMFFFVMRAGYGDPPNTLLRVRVYRWEGPSD